MAIINENDLTTVSKTPLYVLGTVLEDLYGNKFQYVQMTDAVPALKGSPVRSTATPYTVTVDRTGGAANYGRALGVTLAAVDMDVAVAATPDELRFCWIATKHNQVLVATDGNVTAGLFLTATSATADKVAVPVGAITAGESMTVDEAANLTHLFGVALTDDAAVLAIDATLSNPERLVDYCFARIW